jgi:hypothetical protein
MVGESAVSFHHQTSPDLNVVQAIKNNGALATEGILVVDEVLGVLSPVADGVQVVAGVVAIVEASLVVNGVNAGNSRHVVILGIDVIQKGVL